MPLTLLVHFSKVIPYPASPPAIESGHRVNDEHLSQSKRGAKIENL